MNAVLADDVRRALARVIDPEIRRPITELDMIGAVDVADGVARIDLKLTVVGCPAADTIERDVLEAASSVTGVSSVAINVGVMTKLERDTLTDKLRGGRSRDMQFGPDSLTRIYAITSGKGGVGKSTVTANLGVALAARGLRVGIVDADVFGFSIPGLMGITGAKPTQVSEMILPPVAFDVKVISIGMFVDGSTAVSWRGPMLHRTITQFLTDVFFGDLDVLLLDLPPGTGDIAISIGQLLPHAEVIVVTTPRPPPLTSPSAPPSSPARPDRKSSASSRTWRGSFSRTARFSTSSARAVGRMPQPACPRTQNRFPCSRPSP